MKLRRIIVVLAFLSTLLMAMTCDDSNVYRADVALVNNSKEPIYVVEFNFDDYDSISVIVLSRLKHLMIKVEPKGVYNGSVIIPDGNNCRVNDEFVIYKSSTMQKYSEKEIAEKNLIDKHYSYSYEQLKAMGFKIVYEEAYEKNI